MTSHSIYFHDAIETWKSFNDLKHLKKNYDEKSSLNCESELFWNHNENENKRERGEKKAQSSLTGAQ